MSVTIDRDANAVKEGVLALQVHAGPPMVVRFRNFSLEKVDAKAEAEKRASNKKKKSNPNNEAKAQ
jgi:hypothetical protein